MPPSVLSLCRFTPNSHLYKDNPSFFATRSTVILYADLFFIPFRVFSLLMEAPTGILLDFSDPPSVPETALFSFNPLIHLYFTLPFLLVPYQIYRWIAGRFKQETNDKSFARRWSDVMLGLSYETILFVFGKYWPAYR